MSTTPVREFDLQPDPRVLPMLGEISLVQWRCVAELVDNSVDGFLTARRSGAPTENPEVFVNVPTSDMPSAQVTVRDTGPGMDPDSLERAVRAGWTSHDPINNLGMFGMGFNIATARLGSLTTVWTTRQDDPEWYGVEIDLERLVRQRHFKTPMQTRAKSDPREHGTEVAIQRLKPEQRHWLARTAGRTQLARDLGRAYSAMLKPTGIPVGFRLLLNGTAVRGRDHCIWGGEGSPSREIPTSRFGIVNGYQPIDVTLSDRSFCTICWQWLPAGGVVCPACGTNEQVVVRQRRIRGWLGVQRYVSEQDYGIDFLRHGRKIEIANKDLFAWMNPEGVLEPEYPIDDPRHRGRIVGEIHIDHCRVTYMKDRFDRSDPAWEEMVRVVRGEGPLRPDRAENLGVGPNSSPLFLLFQAFRRSTPKSRKNATPPVYTRLLLVRENSRAEEMAKRFYAGEAEYQSDVKWYELAEAADRELLVDTTSGAPGTPGGISGFPTGGPSPGGTGTPEPSAPPSPPPPRTALPVLTRDYRDDLTEYRWNIEAYEVEAGDPGFEGMDTPWRLRANPSGVFEFLVDSHHRIFASATMTPLDGLLAELSWNALDRQRGNPSPVSFAQVLASLRERYAGVSRLDSVALAAEAGATLTAIAKSLRPQVTAEDSRALFGELTPSEQDAVHHRMVGRSVQDPQGVIEDGRFLEFATRRTLIGVVERHPELFFDGRCWETPYTTLDYGRQAATEEARRQVLRRQLALLEDAAWLEVLEPAEAVTTDRARLLRAALALELLASPDEAEEGE